MERFLDNKMSILSITDKETLEGGVETGDTHLGQGQHLVRNSVHSRTRANQGKLLMVALLEQYCQLYDQSSSANQQLFLTLCSYLVKMGILESTDFLDEFSSVRSSYKRAFRDLVIKGMKVSYLLINAPLALQTQSQTSSATLIHLDATVSAAPGEHLPMVASPRLHNRQLPPVTVIKNLPLPNIPTDITELLDMTKSRFEDEFVIVRQIGRGAFGQVLHCHHHLDGRDYALKLIETNSHNGPELSKTLREVKLLSQIEHMNVVRYYSSWFEYTKDFHRSNSASEDYDISPSDTASSAASDPSVISLSLHPLSSSDGSHSAGTGQSRRLTLFLQMELCQLTLLEWIEALNNDVKTYRKIEGKIMSCFMDLLKGIQEIHSKNVIHRDIKPSNIYWKSSLQEQDIHHSLSSLGGRNAGQWKLGDFGLATTSTRENLNARQKQSFEIGTVTYASPEQLARESLPYSDTTDVYSLGIILFELLVPFETAMERVKTITLLRQGVLPDEFLHALPKEAALILWMLSPIPEGRPSISEILKLEWFNLPLNSANSDLSTGNECCRLLRKELEDAYTRISDLEDLLAKK